MCNVFSGLVVTRKGKDWGKVLFLSGVHHEKDREVARKLYADEVLAWESKKPYSCKSFVFTHELNVTKAEQKELMKVLETWWKSQDKNKLLRSMITVTKDNKKIENYKLLDGMVILEDNTSLVCDFSINVKAGDCSTQTAGWRSTQTAGEDSTQTAGEDSTQTAGYRSTQTAGYRSTQTAGEDSTQTAGLSSTQTAGLSSTQTAGYDSTQKAGYDSTQKAGYDSTQTAGWRSTQTAGYDSTQKAGNRSTQTAGEDSTQTAGYRSTQTAGGRSTQTAGDGSTCIIYGTTSYIILNGRNIILRQIYELDGKIINKIIKVDKLFDKYKKGDKILIIKGKPEKQKKSKKL